MQGDELLYLDPHFSRPALETKHIDEYNEQDLETYHCAIPRKIHISQLDPSMLLGYYCRTQADFDAFCERVSEVTEYLTLCILKFSCSNSIPHRLRLRIRQFLPLKTKLLNTTRMFAVKMILA